MPKRTPDKGLMPFDVRVGLSAPTLGGIFRAGDPATTPPHKQHLAVNVRITPGGMITRPGMSQEFDTGTAECIDGLVGAPGGGEDEPLVGLLLAPAGFEQTIDMPDTPGSFALVVEDDLTEPYVLIDAASPLDPNAIFSGSAFVWRGKLHAFTDVVRVNPDGSTSTVMGLVEIVLPRKRGDVGTTKVLCHVAPGRNVVSVDPYPAIVPQRADDLLTGTVQIREMLYFKVWTDDTALIMKYDGATMSEILDLGNVPGNTPAQDAHMVYSQLFRTVDSVMVVSEIMGLEDPADQAPSLILDEDGTWQVEEVFDPAWVGDGTMEPDYFSTLASGKLYIRTRYSDMNGESVEAQVWRRDGPGNWQPRWATNFAGGYAAGSEFILFCRDPTSTTIILVCQNVGAGGAQEAGIFRELSGGTWAFDNWAIPPDTFNTVRSVPSDMMIAGNDYPRWLLEASGIVLLGGRWDDSDPYTNQVNVEGPGHAIYKLEESALNLDKVYEADQEPTYTSAEALATAVGADEDSIVSSILGGA